MTGRLAGVVEAFDLVDAFDLGQRGMAGGVLSLSCSNRSITPTRRGYSIGYGTALAGQHYRDSTPATLHRPLAVVERLFQWGTIPHDPAVDRRVVHGHAALLQRCFDMPIAQGIRHLPAPAREDHLLREMGSLDAEHGLSRMVSA